MGRKPAQLLPLALLCLVTAGCAGPYPLHSETKGTGARLAASQDLASATASDTPTDPADIAQLADPAVVPEVEAVVTPPAGWEPDPPKRSRNHAHQAWLSPSRRTAFGVIRMNLPLPFIGPGQVLGPFLDQMRESEGEATLLARQNDPRLPGIRFVAEGGEYRVRANLVTRGFRAWAVYAGTLRGQPEEPDELQLAELARERTRIGTTRLR